MWREKGITAGVYRNQQQGLISASSDGTTWLTMADKNLWASVVYNEGDTMSVINSWLYYQRWNNYWFGWGTVTIYDEQVDTTWYSRQNPYSSSEFRYWISPSRPDWSNPSNPELRWSTTDTDEARRWPCPSWFHIPSISEVDSLLNIADSLTWWTMPGSTLANIFKIPFSWWRMDDPTWPLHVWTSWYLWTSSSSSYSPNNAGCLWIEDNWRSLNQFIRKTSWHAIRPFKNTSVTPDETRTVLYPSL